MLAPKVETELAIEPLNPKVIQELLRATAPCVTVLLPPYRPGGQSRPAAAHLKVDLQEAARSLTSRRIAEPQIAELLEPLHQLSHEESSLAGSGWARVIFRSPGLFRQFELPVPPSQPNACVVGDCFWIRPIFSSLALPPSVYVLYLTKKSVELLACGLNVVTEVELPKNTPKTIDQALEFDAPDHDLMNRSAGGPSAGAMTGVKFGTGSSRETHRSYLHDFYRIIDRGVNELLHSAQAPLILAGVDEDMAVYRSINAYSNLLEQSIHGSPGAAIGHPQILRYAHDIALFSFERRAALEMALARERFAPARFTTDLDAILKAAVEGRVNDLWLDESGHHLGTFEAKIHGSRTNWHNEDLLNVAAIETLIRSGNVYSLRSHLMPRGVFAAATLRY